MFTNTTDIHLREIILMWQKILDVYIVEIFSYVFCMYSVTSTHLPTEYQ